MLIKTILRLMCLMCAFSCSAKTSNSELTQQSEAGSIDQVAPQFITDLYHDNQLRIFRIDLPSAATLQDHVTGPRIIVLLTDLNGQRIKEGAPIDIKAHQAFYLTNTFSAGFKNTSSQTASYLVFSLEQGTIESQQLACPNNNYISLLMKGPMLVCKSLVRQKLSNAEFKTHKTLIYNQAQSEVKLYNNKQNIEISVGDLVFDFNEAK